MPAMVGVWYHVAMISRGRWRTRSILGVVLLLPLGGQALRGQDTQEPPSTPQVLTVTPPAAPEVPAYQPAGSLTSMRAAWVLRGIADDATILPYTSDRGPELLVAGPRRGGAVPPLGDLALISPEGFARRRLRTADGLAGLPAMVGSVAVAAQTTGGLIFYTLTRPGLENTPRTLEQTGGSRVGPLASGEMTIYSAGPRLYAISQLFEARWSVELPAPVEVGLAIDSQRAYAASAKEILAFDLVSGRPAWRRELASSAVTDLVVADGAVLCGTADGVAVALDAETGTSLWRRELAARRPCTHPALSGPWWIVTLEEGRILALDTATGDEAWSRPLAAAPSSPTLGYGHAFVTTGDGLLVAVPLQAAGTLLQAAARNADDLPVRLTGTPCLAEGRAYVSGTEGQLVAFDLVGASGPRDWPVPGGGAGRAGLSLPLAELDQLATP